MQKYELKLMWTMIRNLLRHLPARHPAVDDLFRQSDSVFALGRHIDVWQQAGYGDDRRTGWVPEDSLPDGLGPLRWQDLADRELRALGRVHPSATRRRLDLIGRLFDIDAPGLAVLEFCYLSEVSPPIGDLLGIAERYGTRPARALSIASGHGVAAIERRLAPTSPLNQYGLLDSARMPRIDSIPEPSPSTRVLLSQPLRTAADARRLLLGRPPQSSLDWDDFEHLGEDAEFLADLLGGALRQGQRGVSVLLHGPPGTGKTEFSQTLAARLNTELYALGEIDDQGGSPNLQERLGSVRMAQHLLRDQGDALLLIDEAEDLLRSAGASAGGLAFGSLRHQPCLARVFLHRLLENAAAPMIWVCNRIGDIDAAVMRRFSFVMEIQSPTRRSRQRVWTRTLARHGFEQCEALASRCAELPVSPGIAAQAVRAARISGRGPDAIERVALQIGRGVAGKPLPTKPASSDAFNPELVCSDPDITALTARLTELRDPRFAVCIHGPPGTGKSAWVRYLAEHMGMDLNRQRASDLLSMFVGGTEANIARAFARARAAGEVLVFDEVDSFLCDRRGARHSWEVTAVNEMLTWMESHPLPFACTTNLLDAVDPAAMRRFTFKLRFGYLDRQRVRAAFRDFFDADWPDAIAPPDGLAPGDFSVVRKRAGIQQIDNPMRLARMLIEECQHKPELSRGIGFLQSADGIRHRRDT